MSKRSRNKNSEKIPLAKKTRSMEQPETDVNSISETIEERLSICLKCGFYVHGTHHNVSYCMSDHMCENDVKDPDKFIDCMVLIGKAASSGNECGSTSLVLPSLLPITSTPKTAPAIPPPPPLPSMRIPGPNGIATVKAANQNSSKESTISPKPKPIALGFDEELNSAVKYA